MDYTKLPRELIYYDRLSIDEFNVDDRESFNYEIFEQIMRLFCIDPTKEETESLILKIFNDAYYILTMVFLEKRPVFRIKRFQSIAKEDSSYLMLIQKESIVFSIVRGVLKLYGTILDSNKSFFCDKLDEYLEDRKKSSGSSNCEIIFSNQTIEMSYEHSHFIPRKITEDVARQIDWVTLTNKFNLEEIKDIVNCIGEGSGEKKIIIKAIYDAESATGNMAAIPYDVDKLLDQLFKKYDEKHKGLRDVYDARRESLNLDTLMENKIDEYMKRNAATEKDIDEMFPDANSNMEQMNNENVSLKAQINDLEEQLKAAKDLDKKRIEEIEKWHGAFENAESEATMWQQKFEEASESCKKAENERDIYKDMIGAGTKKYTVRQTSIIAYALCKKADVIPTNKKNLSPLFNGISGYSSNSMSQNLCSSYSDEEIEVIAASVEKDMPEFAKYLRQKTFFLPEMKK